MQEKEILWLASWYPNEKNPVAGDFIQRHARAVSRLQRITVIYMDQSGWHQTSNDDKTDIQINGNLTEIRRYMPFTKTGIRLLDRIAYNLKYFFEYKRLLQKYFTENGFPRLIHVHVPMKAGKLALWAKRKWGIPYIISEHASTYIESAPDNFENRSSYYRNSVQKIFKGAIAVTNVSKTVAGIIEKKIGISPVHVIHNTVNEELFFHIPSTKKKFRFIHVSTMNEQKNIACLLDTFKILSTCRKDWELRLVGPVSNQLKIRLESFKNEINLSYTGEIPYPQVAIEMQQSSAFVLFSNHENFPCVIAEAFACGLPVITSDAGGAGECIDDKNGKVVPVGNQEKLLQALIEMLDQHHLYNRSVIAVNAKNKFSYPVIGQQFSSLYDKILQP